MERLLEDARRALGDRRLATAERLYRSWLDGRPDDAVAASELAAALSAMERHDEAISMARHAVHHAPERPELWSLLASVCDAGEAFQEAFEAASTAAKLAPEVPDYWLETGLAALNALEPGAAVAPLERARSLRPKDTQILKNLATALRQTHEPTAAQRLLEEALQYVPEDPDLRWNLGLLLLASGRFEDGFRLYEARRQLPALRPPDYGFQAWDGRPLPKSELLVIHEQGFGDTFQFARYLPAARRSVGRLSLLAPDALHPFIRSQQVPGSVFAGVDAVYRLESLKDLSRDVHQAPMCSLALLTGCYEPTPTCLAVDPERQALWRGRLPSFDHLRVGVAWAGSANYRGHQQRAVPLAAFEAIAANPRVQLVSLQQYDGLDQLQDFQGPIRDHTAQLDTEGGAFLDTAALISLMDLVICSDTAVAHLAASMGRPVWLLLAQPCDWRWGFEEAQTNWYPSMRIFRQSSPGEWKPVLLEVETALCSFLDGYRH